MIESHSSFREGGDEADEYMKEHDKACWWVKVNRGMIAVWFLSCLALPCLEPGHEAWELESPEVVTAWILQMWT